MWRSGSGDAPSASDGEFHSYDEDDDPLPLPAKPSDPTPLLLDQPPRDMILLDTEEDSLDHNRHTSMTAPSGTLMLHAAGNNFREGETSSACSTSGVSSSSNALHLRTNSATSDTASRRKRRSNETTSRGKGKSRAEYFFHNLIGEGALGKVFRVVRIQSGEELAIKMVKKSRILHCPALCQMVREEVRIHSREDIIKHPNIVTLKSSFQDETFLYYVFECVTGGTLSKTIERLRQFRTCPVVPVDIIRMWMAELLSVVWTLAHARIIHRDLKPDNVLLQDGHIRVIDFNNALTMTDTQSAVGRMRQEGTRAAAEGSSDRKKDSELSADLGGTLPYWAPERVALCMSRSANRSPTFVAGAGHSRSGSNRATLCPGVELDVWGLGCILYEMLTGTNPFLRATPEMTVDRIMRYAQKAATLDFPANVGPLAKDLCLRLLDPSPACRATMIPNEYEVLLSHPFFAGFTFRSPMTDFNPKALIQSILEQAQTQPKATNVTASLLEFTPEIGRAFDGRPTGDNGASSTSWCYRESIDESGRVPTSTDSNDTPVSQSMRRLEMSGKRTGIESLQPMAAFSEDEDEGSGISEEGDVLVERPSDGDGTPRQADPLLGDGAAGDRTGPSKETLGDRTSPCLRLHAYSFTQNKSRLSCSSGSEMLIAAPCAARVSTPAPKDKLEAPLPTRVSFADESSTAASHQPVMDDWVTRMSSPDFREFMISHLINELTSLLNEETGGEVDENTGVVEAADVMTWGPLKVTLEPAPLLRPCHSRGRLCVSKQQSVSLEGESPTRLSLAESRLSYNSVNRMAPSSQYSTQTESGIPRAASGLLCCVRSPSYLMINRIRRWITPVNTPLPEDSWSEHSARPPSSELTVVRPFYPPSAPPPARIELICFGVLTGQLGLLLFVADVERDECRLAYKLNLKDPQAMGTLSSVPKSATMLRLDFFPGDLPVVERASNRMIKVRSVYLNVGLPAYSANWLGPLGSILIAAEKTSSERSRTTEEEKEAS